MEPKPTRKTERPIVCVDLGDVVLELLDNLRVLVQRRERVLPSRSEVIRRALLLAGAHLADQDLPGGKLPADYHIRRKTM